VERLDQERLRELLRKADDKWISEHPKGWNYQEHINFVAGFVAENYYRRPKKIQPKVRSIKE